jgi:hypothetical protein
VLMGDCRELVHTDSLGEAFDAVVGGVDLQDQDSIGPIAFR